MKEKLSTESYKGVRDFYPEDKYIQKYIFEKMRQVVERFGYEEYDASIIEPTELYKAKSGEEIVNEQTYSFTDRGDREITLRPEMTPTVARMVASKKRELSFPLRWYSIVNNFRYERPQKGRGREFWQLNVDNFGIEGIEAETEAITIAYKIMLNLGAIESDFEIRISYAGIIGIILAEKFDLNTEEKRDLIRLIDRWNGKKISDTDFNKKIEELLGEEKSSKLMKSLVDGEIRKISEAQPESQLCKEIISKLEKAGINNAKFDPFLVRGFDYYTGVVFEVFDKNPENNRAMFGGGRYDNLLDIFGEDKIPAVGFGMGDMTAIEFLKSRDLIPEYLPNTDLYLCITDKKYSEFTEDLAQALRTQDLKIAVDYSFKKLDKQIKTADKKKIPFVICIGEDETKADEFTLKRMIDGKEWKVKREEIKKLIVDSI
jgi:histidyl-tRNA synthetase